MGLTPSTLTFLLSDVGQAWLAETAQLLTQQSHLAVASYLRQKLPVDQTHALLETCLLRQQAASKFALSAQMYFTRDGLEQASGEQIAAYRAGRFAQLNPVWLADLGCGIGGDALALTAVSSHLIGWDLDGVRLRLAQENMRVAGLGERFTAVQTDLRHWHPSPQLSALFFDPARRSAQGRRLFSVAQYQPPLSLWQSWQAKVRDTAVKISPGVAYEELPPPSLAEAEFISLDGEVKECVLWTGNLHSGVARRATLLPCGTTLTTADLPTEGVPISPPQAFLYEPDGALIRAHLVEAVAAQLGAHKLSPEIAYLTADRGQVTPLARCFVVWDWFPFQLKRLRHYLHERGVGEVVIKKRGSPLEPDWLQQALRLNKKREKGKGNTAVLFLTQYQQEPIVIIGAPLA
jgi:hypothetical protein